MSKEVFVMLKSETDNRVFKIVDFDHAKANWQWEEDVFSLSIGTAPDGQFTYKLKLLEGTPRGSRVGKTIYVVEDTYATKDEAEILSPKHFPAYAEDHAKPAKPAKDDDECTCDCEERLEKLFAIYTLGQELEFETWIELIEKQFFGE